MSPYNVLGIWDDRWNKTDVLLPPGESRCMMKKGSSSQHSATIQETTPQGNPREEHLETYVEVKSER